MESPGAAGDAVSRYRAARADPQLAVLEGLHALKHALRFGAEVLEVLAKDRATLLGLADELAPDLLEVLAQRAKTVAEESFDALTPVPHPTGVVALARRPELAAAEILEREGDAPVVFLESPNHLGNLGAVVRVAAAAGAAGVLASGRHDPWHPDALRGAAGLHYAVGVAATRDLPQSDRPLLAVDPEGEPLDRENLPERAVLAFGTERSGLSDEILDRAERRVAIPMREGVSSLNLATAVAVVLYVQEPNPD